MGRKKSKRKRQVLFWLAIFLLILGVAICLKQVDLTGFAVEESSLNQSVVENQSQSEGMVTEVSVGQVQPEVNKKGESIGFEKENNLPKNWFLKENQNVEEKNEHEWKKSNDEQDLVIDLYELTHPELWNSTPRTRVYSKTISNLTGFFNISMEYSESGVETDCFQVAAEILNKDTSSDSTLFLTLNASQASSSDFIVSSSKEDKWIKVDAQSKTFMGSDKKMQFSFVPLCDSGIITVEKFEYFS